MDLPGIEVRPIVDMTGEHAFNEVFFTDVRIPAENLVGDENEGWGLAKVTLSNERVSLSSDGALWGRGPTAARPHRPRAAPGQARRRDRCASGWPRCTSRREILRLIRLRTVSARIKGEQPGPEASIRKVMADEHGQRIMGLAKDLAGPAGMLASSGPLGAPADLWSYGFLYSTALTVGGGTGEVQRNIIAERVLGLPHDL